uniref:Uncharacterized protein n=1 Tax=Schistosoma mansoni TaxID=6183 RepID=A0A5K4F3C5_SCHMA
MKQSTLDCLAIFYVILILVISSIYAGSSTGESQKPRKPKNHAWDFDGLYCKLLFMFHL